MSFPRLLDRIITIVPRIVVGTDERGDDIIGDGTPFQVKAGRDLERENEDTRERDQVTTRWVYFLPRFTPLTAYDRILDGDEVLEVHGQPERIVRRRGGREHHVEAVVIRTQG